MNTGSKVRKRTRWTFRLLLMIGSIVITVLMLEAIARVRAYMNNRDTLESALREPQPLPTDRSATLGEIIRLHPVDRIAYELRPNLKGVDFKGAPLSSNSLGFRSPEYPVEKKAGAVTIVGIGDSIMFGHGVGDGETYIDFLGELLRKKRPDTTWRMINTAVPGYNAMMEVTTLRLKALDFKPDLVIQGLCSNDLAPPNYLRVEDNVLDLSRSFLLEFIQEKIDDQEPGSRFGDNALTNREKWLSETGEDENNAPPRYADLYGRKGFNSALDELKALSEAHGFEVLTLLMFERDNASSMLHKCISLGFISLNMQETIEEYIEKQSGEAFSWELYAHSDLAVSPNNLHPSVLLHKMSALQLYKLLDDSGWIDRVTSR
ncbi:MAG: SGNH/GDSL hydrolase family protein [Planctomycetota bacterium]